MKYENAVLYFRCSLLVPLGVTVAKRQFLVPIRVRFQKKRFGAEQIHAPGQTQFVGERRGGIRVGKPVRTVAQYRCRQRNHPALTLEISPRAKRQPWDVHAEMPQRMSVARLPNLVPHFWLF